MNDGDTHTLAELIQCRHDALRQLHELGQRQMELIVAEEMGHLMTVLAAKQRLLSGLQTTERQLDPFRRQDPAARRWAGPAERERCARLAAECETLLHDIVTLEQQAETEMARRRDLSTARLQTVNTALAVRGAYRADAQPAVSQLDLSSET